MAVKAGRQMSSTDSKEPKPSLPQEHKDDEEETSCVTADGKLDKYVKRVGPLSQNNVRKFARFLSLDDGTIRSIEHDHKDFGLEEIKYQIISTWKSRYGETATDDIFKKALDHVDLKEEADIFCKETRHPTEETGKPGHFSDIGGTLTREHERVRSTVTHVDHSTPLESQSLRQTREDRQTPPVDAETEWPMVRRLRELGLGSLEWFLVVFIAILAGAVAYNELPVYVNALVVLTVTGLLVTRILQTGTAKTIFKDYADAPVELRKPPDHFSAPHENCLKEINKSFEDFKQSRDYNYDVLFQIVYGLGGCGKTEIVSSYAWKYWQRYTGGVFVLNGQSNSYLDFGFKKILEKMNLDLSSEEKTPNNIRRKVLNKLNERKDWLLVIDDADDPDLVWQVLETSKPLCNGHILVTSRVKTGWDKLPKNKFRNITKQQIKPLSVEDSALLLLMMVKADEAKPLSLKETRRELENMKRLDAENYSAIMWLGGEEALHGLPLALKQASRYIADNNINFKTYKKLYNDCDLDVLEARPSDPLEGWLKVHDLDPSHATAFRSIVGSETIDIMSLDEKQLREEPINLDERDLKKFREAIGETSKFDFVKMADLNKESILTTWKINYDNIIKESHTKEFLHLCSCLSSRIQVALFIDGAKYLNFGRLKEFFIPRRLSGKYSGKINIHEKVLQLFKKLGKFSFATKIVGAKEEQEHKRSLSRFGEYTIHHVLQQVVLRHFMELKEKIQSFNSALAVLGMLFPKLEEFEDFRTSAVRDRHSIIAFHTLAVGQQIMTLEDGDFPDLNNIHPLFTAVSTYLFRLGRAKDAKPLCKAMVRVSKLKKPVDNLQLAKDLSYLGRAYYNIETLKKAESYFRESIDVYDEIYKKRKLEVLTVRQRLGRVMQENKEYMKDGEKRGEIETLLNEILCEKREIFKDTDETDHYTIAHALHQLGCFYQETGDYERAEEMLKESLEMRESYWERKRGSVEVEDVAVGNTVLARNYILNDLKETEKTEALLKSALEIKEKSMASANESYQFGLYYLAAFYRATDNDVDSRDYLNRIEIDEYKTLFEETEDQPELAKVFQLEGVWM